jgi:succinate-semialdehyde dehydrogenase/glutarate-semialdehyde dehydrogenase
VRQPHPGDGVYDAFTRRLAETARAMKVADGFEPGAVIGPLIEMKAVEKVEAHIADAVNKGAKVVTGGSRSALDGPFFEPTVLTDVTTDMIITKEEPRPCHTHAPLIGWISRIARSSPLWPAY